MGRQEEWQSRTEAQRRVPSDANLVAHPRLEIDEHSDTWFRHRDKLITSLYNIGVSTNEISEILAEHFRDTHTHTVFNRIRAAKARGRILDPNVHRVRETGNIDQAQVEAVITYHATVLRHASSPEKDSEVAARRYMIGVFAQQDVPTNQIAALLQLSVDDVTSDVAYMKQAGILEENLPKQTEQQTIDDSTYARTRARGAIAEALGGEQEVSGAFQVDPGEATVHEFSTIADMILWEAQRSDAIRLQAAAGTTEVSMVTEQGETAMFDNRPDQRDRQDDTRDERE
jgi:hypothetical protein